MPITNNNHYIPCFWTAYWNPKYFDDNEYRKLNSARKQEIYSLNIKANKVILTITKEIFYEKKMGLAKINEDRIFDFEGSFTARENSVKNILENVIQQEEIKSLEEKIYISSFIYDLITNNFKNFNQNIDRYIESGKQKIDFLIDLHKNHSSTKFLKQEIIPILASEWIIYRAKKFKFPIGDNPVLINDRNILIALSPKMLIKINYKRIVAPETECRIESKISPSIYKDYIDRTIDSSERSIIYHDKVFLDRLRSKNVYKIKFK